MMTAWLLACTAREVRHDGEVVVRVAVDDATDLEVLESLGADLWSEHVVDEALVRVPRSALGRLPGSWEIVIDDLQAAIDATLPQVPSPPGFFDDWRPLDEIDAHLEELASRADWAEVEELGLSREGRPIRGLWLRPDGAKDRLGILITGSQHAREWVAASSAVWIAERLVDGYGVDPDLTALLDQHQVVVVPVANPDGYEHTWTTDRLWRKNRVDNGDGSFGVDLNRNWDAAWGGPGSAASGGSDNYRGASPFSEPETAALRDFVEARRRIGIWLDLHCTGQLALRPWAFSPQPAPDEAPLAAGSAAAAAAMSAVYGTSYDEGAFNTRLYPGSGVAIDWAYGARGMWAWLFELRDKGQYGFLLPADQIVPTGEEALAGLVALATTPDPPRLLLTAPVPPTAGDPLELRTWRAPAGAAVEIYRSFDGFGATILPDGVTLELAGAEIVGTATANAHGTAALELLAPFESSGYTVWFQARVGNRRSTVLQEPVGP